MDWVKNDSKMQNLVDILFSIYVQSNPDSSSPIRKD